MIQTNTNIKKLIQFALKLLAKRDYFKDEIKNKLKEKNAIQDEIDYVVEYIQKFGYLDDGKVLEKYADETARKGKGVIFLKKKLYEKGCSGLTDIFNIEEFYTPLMEEKAAMAFCYKFRKEEYETIRKKLISRGFSFLTVIKVLKNLKKNGIAEYED